MASSRVDYSLARRAILREFQAGRVSRFDICDAHPDLLRAARYCGEAISAPCPVCESGSVVLVSYVFSDDFPKRENGKVWPHKDVGPLLKLGDARLYTVEVCPDCSWNHLRSQTVLAGRRRGNRRPRRASE